VKALPFAVAWLIGLAACAQQPATPIAPWYPAVDEGGNPVSALFEGRVPCSEPALRGCDKVKVALALYRDRSGALKTYRLGRVYVAESPQGSLQVVSGAATSTRGTKLDASAVVIQLDEKAPAEFRAYWAIGENILFVLDAERAPKVGTASWSYVLNRNR
jgi:hypothetical protein